MGPRVPQCDDRTNRRRGRAGPRWSDGMAVVGSPPGAAGRPVQGWSECRSYSHKLGSCGQPGQSGYTADVEPVADRPPYDACDYGAEVTQNAGSVRPYRALTFIEEKVSKDRR